MKKRILNILFSNTFHNKVLLFTVRGFLVAVASFNSSEILQLTTLI
jgi:hypothetical protein